MSPLVVSVSVVISPSQQSDTTRVSDVLFQLRLLLIICLNPLLPHVMINDQSPNLPDFKPTTDPVFTWGYVDSDTFCHLKAAFPFCILVTQKLTRTFKSKDHISYLEQRLPLSCVRTCARAVTTDYSLLQR